LACTTAPNVYLVTASNGTQTCQARFVDNLDGTVTDNQTGLVWEKKSAAGTGDVHDVNNFYTWSSTGVVADGTLYTGFLAGLNDDTSGDGVTTCFANHCDWRIPNISELRSIVTAFSPNCTTSPCIDPAFGPTAASVYWSASSVLFAFPDAFGVNFGNGLVNSLFKTSPYYARAVRSGR
jgi:hypothetical protein